MIEFSKDKIVYEWAKKEVASIESYLAHDWIYAFDVDFDSQYEHKQHLKQLNEQRIYLEHVIEYLRNEINNYEQEEADLNMNEGVYY